MGDAERIGELCREFELDPGVFTIIDEPDTVAAGARAVQLVRSGEADVLMKGLIAVLGSFGHLLGYKASYPQYSKAEGTDRS